MALVGGEKLAHVLKQIGDAASGSVSVGFLDGATYPETGTPVAQVAFWNEFGHGGKFPSPPRPFFRNMIAEKSSGWGVRLGKALAHYNFDGHQALDAMGELISGELAESITKTNEPPLSPVTLALRAKFGNNPHEIRARDVLAAQQAVQDGTASIASGTQAKPLVWTGHLLASIDHEVSDA